MKKIMDDNRKLVEKAVGIPLPCHAPGWQTGFG